MKSRESRKRDHIEIASRQQDGLLDSGFSQVHVVPNCLPEVDLAAVSLETRLPGIPVLKHPMIINAITGGAPAVADVNRKLAETALATDSAMAVGSQYGAVKSGQYAETFKVVREINPRGIIFANTSALATVEEAQAAVDMLEAQALQIHLNVAQELAMEEGDREFSGNLKRIEAIVEHLSVPVIVKETGCGMAAAQIKQLQEIGVTIFDIGGAGGTNFPAIEAERYAASNSELGQWGLPTVLSLLEAKSVCSKENGIIATGGVRTALEVCKALVLGANAVGMAKNILCMADPVTEITQLKNNLKDFMVLTGCTRIAQLSKVPRYLTGDMAEAKRQLLDSK